MHSCTLLAALPELRLLVTTGPRNAAIDVEAARAQGVVVCGTGGTGTAMPEITIGMMIALMRNFAVEDAAMRAGGWQHTIVARPRELPILCTMTGRRWPSGRRSASCRSSR